MLIMFHNRVINFWNKLPDSIVLATILAIVDSFVINVGSDHFRLTSFFSGIVIFAFTNGFFLFTGTC